MEGNWSVKYQIWVCTAYNRSIKERVVIFAQGSLGYRALRRT